MAVKPKGILVAWRQGQDLDDQYGTVAEFEPPATLRVRFDNGEEKRFSVNHMRKSSLPLPEQGGLYWVEFQAGDAVVLRPSGERATVVSHTEVGSRRAYSVLADTGAKVVYESSVRPAAIEDPLERLSVGLVGSLADFGLHKRVNELRCRSRADSLACLTTSRLEAKPHQVSVAHRVVSEYPHRFLLCDEVGLGKTIEAGMIIRELEARGVANRVLVLTPAGLMRQWQFELKTKFNETFSIFDSSTFGYLTSQGVEDPWAATNKVIASHSWVTAKQERTDAIAQVPWDLVVVDEAHHARARRVTSEKTERSQLYRLLQRIAEASPFGRQAMLLLTATPMQLDRSELYYLVELLDPTLFSSFEDFDQHMDELEDLKLAADVLHNWETADEKRNYAIEVVAERLGQEFDEQQLDDRATRRELMQALTDAHSLSEVLIRNRKGVIGGFMPRVAARWEVALTSAERGAYDAVNAYVQEGYRLASETEDRTLAFAMTTFQKLLASSRQALAKSLRGRMRRLMGQAPERGAIDLLDEEAETSRVIEALAVSDNAAEECKRITEVLRVLDAIDVDSKAEVLVSQLRQLYREEHGAKVLIFTQFRETQDMLREVLSADWGVELFHGQMSASQKDAAIERFRTSDTVQILVSTESGGEGRNFQFCHNLVNYDLPWNPMRVEQRIGRVDRIGQQDVVKIFNLCTLETIEERVLDVLEKRIDAFQSTVGGLDPILGEVENKMSKILALSAEEREKKLHELEMDLQRRVEDARDTEERMADFIMETRSFRRDLAERIQLESSGEWTFDAGRVFVDLIKRYGGSLKYVRDGVYHVHLATPLVAFDELTDYIKYGGVERCYCVDPRIAEDQETTEYLAFGHPLVEALASRLMKEPAFRTTVARCSHSVPAWEFNYVLRSSSFAERTEVLSVLIDDDGNFIDDLKVESAGGIRPEPCTPAIEIIGAAEGRAMSRLNELLEEVVRIADERFPLERERLTKFYGHRIRSGREKIEHIRGILAQIEESTSPEQRRILPVWKQNLENAIAAVESLSEREQTQLAELDSKMVPTAEMQLLSVARLLPASL